MLYIQNRADSTLGVIKDFYNDTHQMILSSGVSSYTFTVAKNIEDAEYLVEGNYIVVTDDMGLGWKFTIMNTSQTHTEITVYCEDIGLELVNKVMDAWSAPTTKQPASYYINKAIKDTKWKIGLNQIGNLSRTLKWEGRDTSLNRLLSICTEFDHAEIEFKVRFKNLQVTDYLINIYKKRGANRSDIQMVYGDTVNDITKTSSIEGLATALMGVGSDKELPENSPAEAVADKTTFKDLTYDDGLFFTKAGDKFLRARVANQQFNLKEGYIEDFYEYDTADPQELLNRTITQLKERSEIKVNYEVSVAKFEKTLQLGDTITIIDHDYKPELLLRGRVLEMDKSYTDPSNNTLVLGNFLILYSNINDRLTNLQNQIKNMKLDSNYMWLRYAIDDKGNGMSATPTAETKYFAMLVNKKTGIPSNNPADYAGHWKLIQGVDGKDGIPGATGADGKTSYTHFAYADNVSGTADFSLDDPTGRSYMGVYSDFTKADSTNPDDYVWSYTKGETGPEGMQGAQGPQGDIGIPGKPGIDGKTSYTHVAYADNDEGGGFSQNPTNKAYMGWYSDFTQADSTDITKYAWSLIKGSDGLDGAQGIPGPKGADGKTPYTHIAYADTATGGGLSQLPDSKKYIGMYVDFTENDSSDPTKYAWSLIKGADGKDGTPGKDGIAGKDGIGIKSTNVTYQASSNGTTAPTGAWTANVPTVPAGQYLWTRTIWTYTDNTNETSYSVAYVGTNGNDGTNGVAGKDGVGIKSTTITYAQSTGGTVAPTTGYTTTVPSVASGSFLWTKTTWSYTDGTSESGYSVAKMGEKGAQGPQGDIGIPGKPGIDGKTSYTHVAYADNDEGGGFSQNPTNKAYMGWYSDFTQADSTDITKYAWSLIKGSDGLDGAQGIPGPKGADGKTPYFHSAWANSKDGKTGFSTTDSVNKSYLGTYTDFTQGDSADPTKYAWSLIKGADGINGKDGIPGKAGTDGRTPYFHIAWADSADGKINFSLTNATNRGYLGTYTDFTQADSTDTTKYTWSLIKGRDGTNGAPGKPGSDGKTPYFHQAWADSKDGKVNFSKTDPTNRGYLGTYSDFTQADSADPTKYFWVELVGNLQVGGRNYFLDSKTRIITPPGTANYDWRINISDGFWSNSDRLKSNNIRVSFTLTAKKALTTDFNSALYFSSPSWYSVHFSYPAGTTAPQKYELVFNITDSAFKTDNCFIRFQAKDTSANPFVLENAELEIGTTSTDWSPAPEDTQQQIDSINQGLRDTNSKIAAVTKVDSQATAPTNPKKGDQWWVKDTNGNINAFKIWDGTKWADSIIQQSAMNIGTLNGNKINGATINGSEFTNNFDFTGDDKNHFQGVTQIKDGAVNITWKIPENNQTGHTSLSADGLESIIRDPKGTIVRSARLRMGELELSDGTVFGSLNEQDSYRNSTDTVAWLGGWGDWGYGRGLIHVVRNGRLVTLSGYPHHNNTTTLGNMFQLPAWAKPAGGINIGAVCYNGSVYNPAACRLFINDNGLVNISNAQKGGYVVIGTSYVGQDI